MSYRGAPLVSTNFTIDTFTATAGQTAFVLSQAPASAQSVIMMIDGAIQEPTYSYTVSGTTLTTTAGVGEGNRIAVIHLGMRGVLTTPADGSVNAAQIGNILTMGTTIATTSGTSHDFTSIPAGVRRITMNLAGVSLSGTAFLRFQLGDSGGVETTGYLGGVMRGGGAGDLTGANATSGAETAAGGSGASNIFHGTIACTLLDSATNTWAVIVAIAQSDQPRASIGAYSKSLSATLDRVRLTTTGADTFDAGLVNIIYEK